MKKESSIIRLQSFKGPSVGKYIEHLADLRINIFREYPYLYEGTRENEQEYLQRYLSCDDCLIILAFDGNSDIPIGASTAMPLSEEMDDMQQPFIKAGHTLDSYCYYGESVVHPKYRGQGIGRRFFELRETHAMALKLQNACFCAVVRPENHKSKPSHYSSLESFWKSLGYSKQPHLEASFKWKEIGGQELEPHAMHFWTKRLW